MIDREYAKQQIMRLAGLDYFPRNEPELISDLADALQCAKSPEAARNAIAEILQSKTACPKPAEIRRLADPPADPPAWKGFEPVVLHCEKCEDWGHRLSELKPGGRHWQLRCMCEAGRRLDQKYLDYLNNQNNRRPA